MNNEQQTEYNKQARARRKAAREVMRENLKGEEYLQDIANNNAELLLMSAAVDGAVGLLDTEAAIRKADCRAKIIKIKNDANFKLLNKVLPDLKQIELAVDEDGDVTPVQVIIQAVDASAN
jgi:1-deoxy-D-xylulose 5-phosphate reductoisomerase